MVHDCDYNWKTFVGVYLEDYHVGPFHPGLRQFVTCDDDLAWEWEGEFSVTVGLSRGFDKPAPLGQALARAGDAVPNGVPPEQGAICVDPLRPPSRRSGIPHTLAVSRHRGRKAEITHEFRLIDGRYRTSRRRTDR